MKILQLTWENFGTEDIKSAFESLGHEVRLLQTSQEEQLSLAIGKKIKQAAKEYVPDILFGFNYFPEAATACRDIGLDYYAWVYDNPCVQLYSCTLIYPTNHIFVFDSDTYLKFSGQGIKNMNFLPMAANPARLKKLWTTQGDCMEEDQSAIGLAADKKTAHHYMADVAFVGSLYNEEHNFYNRMMAKGLPEYTGGYLRGLMEAQKLIYGTNIITQHLTGRVLDDMHGALPLEPDAGSVITPAELFTEYVINRQITAEERTGMLGKIGEFNKGVPDGNSNAQNTAEAGIGADDQAFKYVQLALYTRNQNIRIPGWANHGPVDFFEEAPRIFHDSRINLNISLRSIVNGIPLRCFEIMGSGGFLLSSYAGDFGVMGFEDGIDYVSFDSKEMLMDKCRYFLDEAHEEERREIARNGFEKICAEHTYADRVREMLG